LGEVHNRVDAILRLEPRTLVLRSTRTEHDEHLRTEHPGKEPVEFEDVADHAQLIPPNSVLVEDALEYVVVARTAREHRSFQFGNLDSRRYVGGFVSHDELLCQTDHMLRVEAHVETRDLILNRLRARVRHDVDEHTLHPQ